MKMREHLPALTRARPASSGCLTGILGELVAQLEWKFQILPHACPYDWTGSADYEENTVSVGQVEKTTTDFSGGYIGVKRFMV